MSDLKDKIATLSGVKACTDSIKSTCTSLINAHVAVCDAKIAAVNSNIELADNDVQSLYKRQYDIKTKLGSASGNSTVDYTCTVKAGDVYYFDISANAGYKLAIAYYKDDTKVQDLYTISECKSNTILYAPAMYDADTIRFYTNKSGGSLSADIYKCDPINSEIKQLANDLHLADNDIQSLYEMQYDTKTKVGHVTGNSIVDFEYDVATGDVFCFDISANPGYKLAIAYYNEGSKVQDLYTIPECNESTIIYAPAMYNADTIRFYTNKSGGSLSADIYKCSKSSDSAISTCQDDINKINQFIDYANNNGHQKIVEATFDAEGGNIYLTDYTMVKNVTYEIEIDNPSNKLYLIIDDEIFLNLNLPVFTYIMPRTSQEIRIANDPGYSGEATITITNVKPVTLYARDNQIETKLDQSVTQLSSRLTTTESNITSLGSRLSTAESKVTSLIAHDTNEITDQTIEKTFSVIKEQVVTAIIGDITLNDTVVYEMQLLDVEGVSTTVTIRKDGTDLETISLLSGERKYFVLEQSANIILITSNISTSYTGNVTFMLRKVTPKYLALSMNGRISAIETEDKIIAGEGIIVTQTMNGRKVSISQTYLNNAIQSYIDSMAEEVY